jgi:hypothetical protein
MIKFRLKNRNTTRLVFVPVVEHITTQHNKATGEMLTSEQVTALQTLPTTEEEKATWIPVEIETRKTLTENTHFWSLNPSARMELSEVIQERVQGWNEGDQFEILIRKL